MLCIHSYPLATSSNHGVGGMSVYILETAKRLGEQGFIVDIFTHAMWGYEDFTPYRNVHIIHLHSLPMGIQTNDIPSYSTDVSNEISSFMVDNDIYYDVIHSHLWVSALIGDIVSRRFHIPHVVMFHSLGAVKKALLNDYQDHISRIKTEISLMENASCIVIPNETELGVMKKYYNYESDKYRIIPCGVDLDLFFATMRKTAKREVGFDKYDRIILCVGRLEPIKGVDLAVRALALTKSNARLVFVCGENQSARIMNLRKLARELKVETRVQFIEDVPYYDMQKYYSASDMLLNPAYYDSCSLSVMEALACGTPVVSTATGVAPDIVQDGYNGVIVEGNSSELAKGIDKMYKKLGNRRFNKQSLIRSIEDYSWDVIADKMIKMYDELISL